MKLDLNQLVERSMLQQVREALDGVAIGISIAGEDNEDGKPTDEALGLMYKQAREAERLVTAILEGHPEPYLVALHQLTTKAVADHERRL